MQVSVTIACCVRLIDVNTNSSVDIDAEMTGIFLEEAERCLGEMEAAWRVMLDGMPMPAEFWRGAHTIRGNAAMLEFHALSEVAADLERTAKTAADVDLISVGKLELLVSGMNEVRQHVDQIRLQLLGES